MELNFTDLKTSVQKQMEEMVISDMFTVGIDKDFLWETYLRSFPEGTNPIFRERTEHDCQCCRSFIKNAGGAVIIKDNKLVSIWDIKVGGAYQVVVDTLASLVKSKAIKDVFLHSEKTLGTDYNHQQTEDGEVLKWEHFYFILPNKFVNKNDLGTKLSGHRSNKEVFKRSLEELTLDSAEVVLELIEQNSLYRGEEHKSIVELFIKYKKTYDNLETTEKDNFCWGESVKLKGASKIRNTAIGTLLTDISNGILLDDAVKMFESKVAPANYKRTSAIVTKGMILKAQKSAREFGIESSLKRRFAVIDDISINNVIFADKSIKNIISDDIFDELINEAPTKIKNLDKIEEIGIEDFIKNVVPSSTSIEMMVENRHKNNFMSLISPVDKKAKGILKWGNNFSWSYVNDVTDSMRERVKSLGGRIDGAIRFTHSWNELEPNQSLMDGHVFMPGSTHSNKSIHETYGNYERVGWNNRKHFKSGGIQDVDYVNPAPKGYVPIENITFPNIHKMPDGKYIYKIHNWSYRNSGGKGKAEIEFNGNIYQYTYPRTKHHEWITVAEVVLKDGKFSIKHVLPESQESAKVCGINTHTFTKVNTIMYSPNHWDGEQTGNKHYFFILDGCKQDGKVRGFFNEFLNENFREHRKVFEVLGNKMMCEESDNQLSGIGFSSTQRNSIVCKVTGSFTRLLKINF